jgi:hypothetical protein
MIGVSVIFLSYTWDCFIKFNIKYTMDIHTSYFTFAPPQVINFSFKKAWYEGYFLKTI